VHLFVVTSEHPNGKKSDEAKCFTDNTVCMIFWSVCIYSFRSKYHIFKVSTLLHVIFIFCLFSVNDNNITATFARR